MCVHQRGRAAGENVESRRPENPYGSSNQTNSWWAVDVIRSSQRLLLLPVDRPLATEFDLIARAEAEMSVYRVSRSRLVRQIVSTLVLVRVRICALKPLALALVVPAVAVPSLPAEVVIAVAAAVVVVAIAVAVVVVAVWGGDISWYLFLLRVPASTSTAAKPSSSSSPITNSIHSCSFRVAVYCV